MNVIAINIQSQIIYFMIVKMHIGFYIFLKLSIYVTISVFSCVYLDD